MPTNSIVISVIGGCVVVGGLVVGCGTLNSHRTHGTSVVGFLHNEFFRFHQA